MASCTHTHHNMGAELYEEFDFTPRLKSPLNKAWGELHGAAKHAAFCLAQPAAISQRS